MDAVRTRPQHLLLSARGLVLVYVLLCVLTVLFSRSFFWETLYEGRVPDTLSLIVFFTIPAALLVFFCVAGINLVGDLIAGRPGIKFRARLMAYFVTIVVLTAVPMTIVTSISINEIVRFWHSFDAEAAKRASRSFAVDNFSFHLERFSGLLAGLPAELPSPLPEGIASVQDYTMYFGAGWREHAFAGNGAGWLAMPPSQLPGFPVRELPRDMDFIRYVRVTGPGEIRVVSYALPVGFDAGVAAIEVQAERFEVIGILRDNVRILEFFYYAMFFLPPLLMTMLIAFSFTKRVTTPIVELTEATRRVTEGDFSIQILPRRKDEFGALVRSFNTMVQNLEKTRASLVRAEKISIWQNMAQQLAHEIRNPLTPIKLSAERVLRRWRNDPERISEIIEDSMLAIVQETEGLSTMLDEFRTLSRPMEPSKSLIKIGEAVAEVLGPYRTSYSKVQFDVSHADDSTNVRIDKSRFSRVLMNLMANAIDAMDGKGAIEIRTDLVKKKEVRYCRISVRDSGKGISDKDAAGLFTPYFTTKESGTGLGLPIVERIVNDHGGTIWFNSGEGVGTTFFIDLPAGEEEGEWP